MRASVTMVNLLAGELQIPLRSAANGTGSHIFCQQRSQFQKGYLNQTVKWKKPGCPGRREALPGDAESIYNGCISHKYIFINKIIIVYPTLLYICIFNNS